MPVYWFLAFLWRRAEADTWLPVEAVTKSEHPLDYMARARQINPENAFCLTFFCEIPAEVYERHSGRV